MKEHLVLYRDQFATRTNILMGLLTVYFQSAYLASNRKLNIIENSHLERR
jgi:hypothetical protein